MTIEDIQRICGRYRGVTHDIKWTDRLCFCVAGKMFLITAPDEVPCSASIKVPKEELGDILEREGFLPAPYLTRHNWVLVDDIARLTSHQWERWIDTAYRLVVDRLSLKIRKELGKISASDRQTGPRHFRL